MRSNFDELNPQRHLVVEDTNVNNPEYVNDTPPLVEDSEQEEKCFELLSAYIDGEVTPCERRQVQEWLDNDPKIHQLYIKLSRIHQAIEQIPIPASASVPSSQLTEQVFQRLDGRRKSGFVSLGVAIIGAIVLGILTGLVVKNNSELPKLAKQTLTNASDNSEGLMIALNQPVMDIPTIGILPPKNSSSDQ
ncbi:anti-sigma factor family protein [Gloeothece verrucosa]|uniref:Putative transmembrane anti-sigma factor n=1 Tax=Gloeothece verrucosa (strain PCC 7822) TaxID=497965 RepID=E0U8W9_GLOV7|nr:anti-sigma factor [Gloeothece verrucosa]ADN16108.1 putative transmembrane anti-sigma factor [Gloeothece verrucosa PCC 7822]